MFENDKNVQLYEMIQQVFSMLDSEELPQTAGALSNLLAGSADGLPEPLAIANGIMDLDKPKTFPDYVIDFVTELYEMEIAEGNDEAMKVIQEKRKEAGFTQAQLADRLGVTAPAVNRWEKDLSYPDASLLAPLARVLRIDMNQLFSFYQYLSEKERKLISFKVNEMLMGKDDENAFAYIGDVLSQYPTDGLLYKDLADTLLGLRALFKSKNPTIYLGKIVEFYEKAAELCPEEEEASVILQGSM